MWLTIGRPAAEAPGAGRQELVRGACVARRYEVRRLLGAGATGEVWEAEDLAVEGRIVALKKLQAGRASPELRSRFRREAEVLSRIRSEHVARFLDLVVDDAFGAVLVLERVAGESLSELLKRRLLTVEEAIDLGIDLLAGVADLHRADVVHRDLKPANVLLRPGAGDLGRAVIVDLGASRLLAAEGGDEDEEITVITRGPMVIGTLAYLAPEQLIDSSAVRPAADVYAVGAILYRAVAGNSPFAGADDIEVVARKRSEDAPMLATGRDDARAASFERVLATALKRRSAERFLTAEEMRRALEEARAEPGPAAVAAPAAAPPPSDEAESLEQTIRRPMATPPERPRKACFPPRTKAACAVAVALAVPLGFAIGAALSPPELSAVRPLARAVETSPSPEPASPEPAAAPPDETARETPRMPIPRPPPAWSRKAARAAPGPPSAEPQPTRAPDGDVAPPSPETGSPPARHARLEPLK